MYKVSEVEWQDAKGRTIDDPIAYRIANERLRHEIADETFQDALDNLFFWAEEDECLIQ